MIERKCSICLVFGLVATSFGLGARPVDAAIIAYDDFESYSEGATIVGENGGTGGWSAAWAGNTTTDHVALTTSGTIAAHGRSLELGRSGTPTSNANSYSVARRAFSPQTDTVYIGFTFQTNDWTSAFFSIQGNNFFADAPPTSDHTQRSLSAGILNQATSNYHARKGFTGGTTVDSGVSHTSNTIHTMVLKFSKSTGVATDVYDEIAIWVDQLSEATPTAVVGASDPQGSADGDTLSAFHFRLNVADERVYIDNLTIATTFGEAVPEPMGFVLAGCGAAGLLLAAYRRHKLASVVSCR